MNHQPVGASPQYYQVHHHLSLTNRPQLQYHPALNQHQYQDYHDAALAATLGYRCVQLPHQQQAEDRTRCAEHQPAASVFRHPDFRPHQTFPIRAYQRIQHHGHYQPVMAAFGDMTEEEVAELQQRSNDFQPQVMVPIAFGYFEALGHLGDVTKFATEEARLRSLVNVVSNAGIDAGLYGDFADEVYDLLRSLRQALHKHDMEPTLMGAFNDETVQNYIITCVKTLTSAWMKTRPDAWANWLPGQSVDRYCDEQVMPIGSEIDSVSLHALKDVLLEPAGIALEVIYLDRSVGSEVNTLHLESVTSGDFTTGIIRLLYRP
nr:ubiquitin thioesterase otubain-like [Quercus suber]